MKKTIVVTSIFAVCILMVLPLTSVVESSNMPVKRINRLRAMLVKESKLRLSIGCVMWIILLIFIIACDIVVSTLQELRDEGII